MDLKEKVSSLPCSPGVYLMKDSLGNIIYVGKSKNLKSRVSTYFCNNKNRSSKIERLISNIQDFEFITLDTEFDALLMECKLIKSIKPRYNKLMKNELRYQYIKITIKDIYPSIKLVESELEDGNLYFGPFTNYNGACQIVSFLIDELPLRKCGTLPNNKTISTCLNYDLNKCFGVCKYDNSQKEYGDVINNIIDFFTLKNKKLITYFENEMIYCSNIMNYEKAQFLKDNIQKLKYLHQSLLDIRNLKSKKKLLVMEVYNESFLKVFFVNGKEVTYSKNYNTDAKQKEEIAVEIYDKLIQWLKEAEATELQVHETNEDEKNIIDEFLIINSYIKKKSNNCLSYIEIKENLSYSDKYMKKIKDMLNKTISYFT